MTIGNVNIIDDRQSRATNENQVLEVDFHLEQIVARDSFVVRIEMIFSWFQSRVPVTKEKSGAQDILHKVEIYLKVIEDVKPFSTKRILSRESTFPSTNRIDPSLVPAESSGNKRKSRFEQKNSSTGKELL